MALTDDDHLDFDRDRLADFDLDRALRALAEQGDVYRTQLVAARWIDGWRERVLENPSLTDDETFRAGWDAALREVIAHLRQGDLIPGGVLYGGDNRAAGPVTAPSQPNAARGRRVSSRR